MSTNVREFYDFVLQQIAAESYLNQATDFGGTLDTQDVLMYGSNNPINQQQRNNLSTTPILSGATRMTGTQTDDFLTRYRIVSHLPNTATGFSGTLMERLDVQGNGTGEYTFAMRSTEYLNTDEGGDWERDGLSGTDGEILLKGFALGQIASMESYYDHLKAGESYDATIGQWLHDPALADFKGRFGQGGTGGVLNVSGYSLSGNLASVFTALHPEVDYTYVYNAAGRGNIGNGTLENMVLVLRERLAEAGINVSDPGNANLFAPNLQPDVPTTYQLITTGIQLEFNTSYTVFGNAGLPERRITQLYGQAAHNDVNRVANSGLHVPAEKIFIEDQPDIQGLILFGQNSDFGTTHSITLLVDSLAVMSAFERLGLDMSTPHGLEVAYNILAAGTHERATGLIGTNGVAERDSLETIVSGLHRLLIGSDIALMSDPSVRGFSNLTNRDDFYKVLDAINQKIATAGTLSLESLVGKTANDIILAAANPDPTNTSTIAYRYSLKTMNPFAVIGIDYSVHNQGGELDLYDPTTGRGELTERWLQDRSQFLHKKNVAYGADSDLLIEPGVPNTVLLDVGSSVQIYTTNNLEMPSYPTDPRRIAFGDNVTRDLLLGADEDDSLYGGGGNDEAHGFGEKDYVEGNSGLDDLYGDGGDDVLFGGIGNDHLYGGADDDYLDGGADDDIMDGGQGRDIYVIFGQDHITETSAASGDLIRYWVDENNQRTLKYVSGAFVNMGARYLLVNDPSITAIKNGPTLTIYLPNSGSVAIDNFVSGQFGLSLQEIPVIPQTSSTIVGDYTPVDFNPDPFGVEQQFDSLGNVIADPSQPYPRRRDFLYGGAGNDRLMGQQGSDVLEGRGGDDILEGGLDPSGSSEYLLGGAGNDQIFSTSYFSIGELQSYINYVGNYGGDIGDRDVLLGNEGDDVVVGDAGDSLIFGGDGQDLVLGGSGNDFISGDDNDVVGFGTWGNYPPQQSLVPLSSIGLPSYGADEYLLAAPAVTGGADWVYAGSGNDLVFGLFGDDVIYGEEGDDGIGGGSGSDEIFGGNGADRLAGDNYGRLQNGQPWSSVDDGHDNIDGGAGNDLIWGEGGNDILLGGTGVNSLYGGAGNDYLVGGDGDLLVGEEGNDVLLGGSGTDSLNGGAGNDSLYGGDAFDFLSGEDGDDVIYGEGGSDQLSGDAGNDLIDGGDGSDYMFGGAGDDTYFVDALDTIGDVEGQNYVLFTDATTVEDIQVDRLVQDSFDVLFLTIGDGGFIPGHPIFTYQDPNQASYFQSFTFGDGVTLAMDEILGLRFDGSKTGSGTEEGDKLSGYGGNDDLDGAGGNDVLRGYSGDDILIGGAGVDMLSGGEGNDTLDGGAGTDTLVGGAGNDIYLFDSGSGPDTISENDSTAGNVDIVQFTSRIVPADVTATRDASNLYLSLSGGVDQITLQNWFVSDANKVEQVKFANGTVWNVAQLAAMSQEANHAPTVTNAIADQSATEDAVFNFVVPANSFVDVDAGDTLNYGAALTDDSALPSWLGFNASTHTFNGTPINANVGTIKVKVTATDATSATASDVFDVVVTNANDAPTVVNAIADQNIMEDSAFTFLVPTNSFADVDVGDSLVYSATLANGSALPPWLTFNAATLTFVGSPTFTNAGTVSVRVTASDGAMLSASDDFDLTVNLNSDLAINGTSANDSLVGHSGNDTINGNSGADTMAGARGNDTYVVDNMDDVITEFASQGTDLVQSSVTYTLAANVENLTLTGSTAINGKGNSLDNILTGNSGNNTISAGAGNDILNGGAGTDRLVGGAGNDILQGFEGNDILTDRRGNGLFDGGRGNDTMKGNANNQMFIGGAGNDSITTGPGADIIAFNRGAGRDIVNASTGIDNSISLGGGIRYSNLTFTKSGSDLVLNTGGTDKLILADWYTGTTNKSVVKLQVIAEAMPGYNPARNDILFSKKVVTFNFAALAAAFDSAGQVNGWALTNALLNAHLSGSDTDAIGGDLAYQYGKSGSLTGIGLTSVQDVINSAQFGSSAQSLHTLTELQRGQIRLS